MSKKEREIERKVYIQKIDELTKRCNYLEKQVEIEGRFKKAYESLCNEYKEKIDEIDRLKTRYSKLITSLESSIKELEK